METKIISDVKDRDCIVCYTDYKGIKREQIVRLGTESNTLLYPIKDGTRIYLSPAENQTKVSGTITGYLKTIIE